LRLVAQLEPVTQRTSERLRLVAVLFCRRLKPSLWLCSSRWLLRGSDRLGGMYRNSPGAIIAFANRCARTRTLRTSSRSVGNAPHGEGFSPVSFLTPRRFTNPPTRTHVRLLDPCYKTGRMESPPTNTTSVQVHSGPPQGRTLRSSTATTANQQVVLHPRLCRCNGLCWFAPRVERRTSLSRSASDRDASPASIRFPPGNFKRSGMRFK